MSSPPASQPPPPQQQAPPTSSNSEATSSQRPRSPRVLERFENGRIKRWIGEPPDFWEKGATIYFKEKESDEIGLEDSGFDVRLDCTGNGNLKLIVSQGWRIYYFTYGKDDYHVFLRPQEIVALMVRDQKHMKYLDIIEWIALDMTTPEKRVDMELLFPTGFQRKKNIFYVSFDKPPPEVNLFAKRINRHQPQFGTRIDNIDYPTSEHEESESEHESEQRPKKRQRTEEKEDEEQ